MPALRECAVGVELGFTLRAVGLYSLAIADSNTNGSAWAKLGSGADIPLHSGAKHIYTRKCFDLDGYRRVLRCEFCTYGGFARWFSGGSCLVSAVNYD